LGPAISARATRSSPRSSSTIRTSSRGSCWRRRPAPNCASSRSTRGPSPLDDLDAKLRGVKLVALSHVSNTLGTIAPLETIVPAAHAAGAVVLIDGAQSAPHFPVDVRALDVDFFAASGHKMCGPTGIGFLYGKRALLEAMPPFLTGGDMIKVGTTSTTFNELPWKFEAGTSNVADAVALGAAVDYLESVGMDWIANTSAH
jgi:cysteine desulfurase/selenocysteine lyase